MPTTWEDSRRRTDAAHEMLLGLAGRAADDLLAQCRLWLAAGAEENLTRAVTFAALAQQVTLTRAEVSVLGGLLEASGGSEDMLTEVVVDDDGPLPPYTFAATAAGPGGPGPGAPDSRALDEIDRTAVEALRGQPGALGMWRAWRRPADRSTWPPPRRVYLVEAAAATELPALGARIQRDLDFGGERDGQVEAYRTGMTLPPYHRLARAAGVLVWAAAGDEEIRVARVFDEVDADGPRFHADHPRLADSRERSRVLDYLDAGRAILVNAARMDDVIDPAGAESVPVTFRTDGAWVWTDATTYYLREHGLAPDPDLLAHIRLAGYTPPGVDGVTVHRALAVVMKPPSEEPVWPPVDDADPDDDA